MSSLGFSNINDNLYINDEMESIKSSSKSNINTNTKPSLRNKTIKKKQITNGNNENVQNMLKLINNSNGFEGFDNLNDESELSDFNPPPKPELSKLKHNKNSQNNEIEIDEEKPSISDDSIITSEQTKMLSNDLDSLHYDNIPNSRAMPSGQAMPSGYGQSIPNPASLDIYDTPPLKEGFNHLPTSYPKNFIPYYNQINQGSANKDQLMEKLNYMIHLLEEQKDEKTGHVMEEVILYSFLGVFIIFIVDSFARAGKYTR